MICKYFFSFHRLSFHFLDGFVCSIEVLIFIQSHLSTSSFVAFGTYLRKHCIIQTDSSKNLTVSALTSMIRVCVLSHSVVSNSLQPQRLQPVRLLCPWDFPGTSTGVWCHLLLQGAFPTQDLTCVSCISCTGRRILYHQCHLESQVFPFFFFFHQQYLK